jgi:HAD superfamily hydrolase (TIGR01509 family)
MKTRLSICAKKARYPTEAEALSVTKNASITLRHYRCDRCQQFHLTSRTKGKRVIRPVRCVIFDLDGTLVDSETANNQALLDLLPALSSNVAPLIELYRGKKLADIFTDIESKLELKLPVDFESTYRNRVAAIFDSELTSMPGAEDMLRAIDVPMCVASSGPMRKIRHALDLTDLSRFFGQNIFSAYEVGFWKPDPRLFLHAAKKMGVAPISCAVVEDSPVGIAAAIAAGMQPIHYSPQGGEIKKGGVTVIRDLRELTNVRLGIRKP